MRADRAGAREAVRPDDATRGADPARWQRLGSPALII
jgi:hypothetical protein